MIAVLSVALLLLQEPVAPRPPQQPARPATRDDDTSQAIVYRREERDARRASRPRRPRPSDVSPEMEASAFASEGARTLFRRAQEARLRSDADLRGYDAKVVRRISAGIAFSKMGRERLAFRHESAARVRWQQGAGAFVDITGARTALPAVHGIDQAQREVQRNLSTNLPVTVPYFPGQDRLMPLAGLAPEEVERDAPIHPIAAGAENYYTYELGDSLSVRLPDGKTIVIREMRFRAREPKWNVAVGSLWFDVESAQLVRAAYRFAVPFNIAEFVEQEDPGEFDDVPALVKPLIFPMIAEFNAISIEYGLHEGRFWLPKAQVGEGSIRVGFVRSPVRLEERFSYASVNGADSLAETRREIARRRDVADSIREERLAERGRIRARMQAATDTAERDSLARELRRAIARDRAAREESLDGDQCPSADGEFTRRHRWYDGSLRVTVSAPCDARKLAQSPDLPASIYDDGEEVFGQSELNALLDEAKRLGVQPAFAPQLPRVHLSSDELLRLARYNRVEGLSGAVRADQQFGAGYTASALVRVGTADLRPQGELSFVRAGGGRLVQGGVYRRLAVSSDWGNPLGFGSSLSALLFGRDEGFYYYAWGAELTGAGEGNPFFSWRLFAERQSDADVNTQISLARAINNKRFLPNVDADEGTLFGTGARVQRTIGADPQGRRLMLDARGEGGMGAFAYTRGLLDATLSTGLGSRLGAGITGSAGSSTGVLPAQRQFFLGGPQSVRGQWAGTMRGNAYWMTRAELGSGAVSVRPTIYADLGWAGDRTDWRHPGRVMSGVGTGASLLDGLIRFDLARGLSPVKMWRADMYVEARF